MAEDVKEMEILKKMAQTMILDDIFAHLVEEACKVFALMRENPEQEVELLMVDVISSLYQEKPEISEINKLIDKKFEIKKAGMKKLIAAFVGIKKLLSKEQMKQVKAICKAEGHSQSKEGQCRR